MKKPKEMPTWLKMEEPLKVGRKLGSGPTQQLIIKVFDQAAQYGVTQLWPSQVHKGAQELFGYSATRDVIQECMKKLVRDGFLRWDHSGYIVVKRPEPSKNPPASPLRWSELGVNGTRQ